MNTSPFRSNNYVNPKILLFLLNRRKQRNLNEILLFPNRSNLAQKVNPISVRLHMNRSSDSSRFSDHYYGQFVYQDVNPLDYFGSIRPPTRRNPFGFRLGRGILHHSPKRTFIHLYLLRRPPLNSNSRGRGRSRPWEPPRWAVEKKGKSKEKKGKSKNSKGKSKNSKGKSIRIPLLRGDSTEERRGLGAGETVVRSIRLDDRSKVVWRAKQRYEYHDRSPPYSSLGRGNVSNPAVRPPCFDYLVMQYPFRLENPLSYRKPVARSASSECCDHYSLDRCSLFPFFFGATLFEKRGNKLRRVGYRWFPRKRAWAFFVSRSKKRIKTYLLRRSKKIFRKPFHTYMNRGSGSVKKLLGRIGGVMRRIEMMLEVRLRRPGIPYALNYYTNEVQKVRSLLKKRTNTNIFIGSVKIKYVYQSASPIAQDISLRLRDRKSFRSIFNEPVQNIPLVMLKRVGGIRICCSGRLKGAEIARTECMEYEKTSCNAFRHRIDYASAKVSTRYGILGVKVWIPFL